MFITCRVWLFRRRDADVLTESLKKLSCVVGDGVILGDDTRKLPQGRHCQPSWTGRSPGCLSRMEGMCFSTSGGVFERMRDFQPKLHGGPRFNNFRREVNLMDLVIEKIYKV